MAFRRAKVQRSGSTALRSQIESRLRVTQDVAVVQNLGYVQTTGRTYMSSLGLPGGVVPFRRHGSVSVSQDRSTSMAAWRFEDLHPGPELGEHVTLLPANDVSEVHLRWSATATNRTGKATGTITLAVAPGEMQLQAED
jgi:hypothetical protein